MIVGNAEEAIKYAVKNMYTEEELIKYRNIIRNFTELYYDKYVQTWANTRWKSIPVYKCPTDLWIYQELIYEIKPTVIVETGTAFGGSALYLRDIGRVCGCYPVIISIDKDHNKIVDSIRYEENIILLEGDSSEEETLIRVKAHISSRMINHKIMVILDSDHKKDHVIKELNLFASLVTPGSILIVEDTIINGNPVHKEHGPGPKEAIEEWWVDHPEFELNVMCEKLMLTFNRGGYLERKNV
jgi:cephalosporin hydroxylase